MKAWIASFFFALSLLLPTAFAKTINYSKLDFSPKWQELTPEQQAIAGWIEKVNNSGISPDKVIEIVKATYAEAEKLNLDPMRLLAITRVESRFNPNAVSKHGAKGLMQVMARVHKDRLKGRSPYNLYTSIEVGSSIYKDYLDQAGGNAIKALKMYVGGPGMEYPRMVLKAEKELRRHVIFALFDTGPGSQRDTLYALN